MPPHPAVQPRKAPKQQRSRATVEAILVATSQILTEHGYDKTTTNLVAKRAGVSIGSLYQYFPNKESLIAALCEQHMRAVTDGVIGALEQARKLPLGDALEIIIRGLLSHHAEDNELQKILAEYSPTLIGLDYCKEIDRCVEAAVAEHLAQRPEDLRPANLELGAFMLVHGVEGITHAAVMRRPDALESGALARELVDLVQRYLLPEGGARREAIAAE